MNASPDRKLLRAAIYTRKSSEEGLEQSFNSLAAQRESCEAYIRSQQQEGWECIPTLYDDGGYSGGNTERPGLTQLLEDINHGKIDVVVVYKVDRLSRSLTDFVRLMEHFDQHQVSFVSVTQQFNTSTSMGRLTLNVLLSFAQFEREVTSERIRDKIAASKKKGMWMGGIVPLGYDVIDKALIINPEEQKTVIDIYERYLTLGCVRKLKASLDRDGVVSKARRKEGKLVPGRPFSRGALYHLLKNPIYIGQVNHKTSLYKGQQDTLLPQGLWETVQKRLATHRHDKALRLSAKAPSLLAGLLYDDRGYRMSPSHAKKGSTRYRYYVSQAVMQFNERKGGSVLRIAATVLEEQVVNRLRSLLHSPTDLAARLEAFHLSTDELRAFVQAAESLHDRWESLAPSAHIDVLKKLFQKIVVGKNNIVLYFSPARWIAYLCPDIRVHDHHQEEIVPHSIPVTLKRCGIETKLILASGENDRPHLRTVYAIQEALRKALHWQQGFLTGHIASFATLARQEQVDVRQIARFLRLAYLAPDIQEAIFSGEVPLALTLTTLKRGFPLDWTAQRIQLGFSAT